ncbi:hypothetical protein EsDP_00002474 [Epichloe bromicola]|uniref:Uncharacterized protein n=1 Tax=Epichloe bromicola TaxID=79588 RepID=A0ABQ0CKW3_9HYPO
MFELPEAKRVRREELYASDADSWSDAVEETIDSHLEARLNAQIAKSLGLDAQKTGQQSEQPELLQTSHLPPIRAGSNETADTDADDEHDNGDLGEFEFRLFSSAAPAKVTLEDESARPREGALAYPRPSSFYAVRSIPDKLRSEYRFAAVSGEEVILGSHRPSWGSDHAWKVTRTTVTRKARAGEKDGVSTHVDGDDGGGRRKRPGKRRRITDRQKARAQREGEVAEKKKAVEKEEQLREKKKKLNRLKKLRKRAKSKEMKAGEQGNSDGDSGDAHAASN